MRDSDIFVYHFHFFPQTHNQMEKILQHIVWNATFLFTENKADNKQNGNRWNTLSPTYSQMNLTWKKTYFINIECFSVDKFVF